MFENKNKTAAEVVAGIKQEEDRKKETDQLTDNQIGDWLMSGLPPRKFA
jgi:hypothetical protein